MLLMPKRPMIWVSQMYARTSDNDGLTPELPRPAESAGSTGGRQLRDVEHAPLVMGQHGPEPPQLFRGQGVPQRAFRRGAVPGLG
jgi:hypothetical protein